MTTLRPGAASSTSPNPTPSVSASASYSGPPTPTAVATQLGIPLDAVCKLDANESPFGAPPLARAALAALANPTTELGGASRYPDADATELRDALAQYTDTDAEHIVVGNGSDELIALLSELYTQPGDEVVVSEPTFGVYALAARRCGAQVIDTGRDGNFDVTPKDLLAAITPRTRLVYLCAPNNPTGTPLARATALAVLDHAESLAAGGRSPLVVVDEAYYEFGAFAGAPEVWTLAALVAQRKQLAVLRTFSKIFGLAGLRVGYALCPAEVAERLRKRKEPYNVNVAGQVAAIAALQDISWLRYRAVELVAERVRLAAALVQLPNLRVYPSAANFLLLDLLSPDGRPSMEQRDALWQGLVARGILVRRLSGARLATTVRVTIGTPAQNDRFLAALAALLATPPADSDARKNGSRP